MAADALSRVGHLLALQAVSAVQPQWLQEVLNSYVTNKEAQSLLAQLVLASPNDQGFFIRKWLNQTQRKNLGGSKLSSSNQNYLSPTF